MSSWTIPIVFVFLASLMAWILIGSKGLWWLKLLMMIATLLLAVQIWGLSESYLGFAKPSTIEQMKGVRASILWSVVREPDYIYLWMVIGKEDPKVYRFPYSKPLHKDAASAMDQILVDKGEPVEVVMGAKANKDSGSSEYGTHGGTGSGGGTTDAIGEFYILPAPLISPKVMQH